MTKKRGYLLNNKKIDGVTLSKKLDENGVKNKITSNGLVYADVNYTNKASNGEEYTNGFTRIHGTNITIMNGKLYQEFNPFATFYL